MILSALPHFARILLLGVIGGCVGSFINWAIYSWPYFLKRPFSPWMKPDEKSANRTWVDRIPVIGWLFLRREHDVHGTAFWLRPLLIELVWLLGLPWFYYWQLAGGLTGGTLIPTPPNWDVWVETWFAAHTILIALMFIATFIDFDERTIPDNITVPGTLIALLFAMFTPWFRLPQIVPNMRGVTLEPIHFTSAAPLPAWHYTWLGLTIAVAIFVIWILALLPKICTLRYGLVRGIKIMIASTARPARKSDCDFRIQQRRPEPMTLTLILIGLIGSLTIVAARQWLSLTNWDSLFGSLVGLGFGGGMVWSIRIVARYAMQREAMGFGDVTLMAMIGAFLGWQSALLTFAIAPFAALLIVLACFLITKETELAFGPYLCFGCLMLLFGWSQIWPGAARQFFAFGPLLFVFLLIALVAMAVLLLMIQWFKSKFLYGDEEEME